jgi:hypothetical protein
MAPAGCYSFDKTGAAPERLTRIYHGAIFMKKALAGAGVIVLATVIGVVLLSSEKKAESAVIVTDMTIEGMSCRNCADKVDAALSQLNGVKEWKCAWQTEWRRSNMMPRS